MITPAMTYSRRGLEYTGRAEGERFEAYPDPGSGGDPWTIGMGTTVYPDGTPVKRGDKSTHEENLVWLAHDIQKVVDAINRDFVGPQLTQHQFDALTDFAYNLGISAEEHSTLWRMVEAGDFAGAAEQFPRWDMAGGKHLPGLKIRRLDEKKDFLTPDDDIAKAPGETS